MIANLDAAQLEVDLIKEYLAYNPDNGHFTWSKSNNKKIKVGSRADINSNHGYKRIQVCGKRYLAHRLAFVFMLGRFPINLVDHINLETNDNRWVNLREANYLQNQFNRGIRRSNTSGKRNVWWSPQHKKWRTGIYINGKRKHIGCFTTVEEASNAYETLAKQVQGDFYCKGEEHHDSKL